MNDKLYLKKLKSEYKFLKVEVEYQAELFETAKKEFDKKFSNLLNLNIPNEKKVKEKKSVRKKSLNKVYKKLAQKIHPDKKTGDTEDFRKLKKSVDDSDIDTMMDLADEYDIDIEVEVNQKDILLGKIERLKNKLDYYKKTLIMQWYTIDDSEKENFENVILNTLGK
tara:strand:+ start:148 stop:648 length:501 start_codon:yes stop_codon:yes gene_type:complete